MLFRGILVWSSVQDPDVGVRAKCCRPCSPKEVTPPPSDRDLKMGHHLQVGVSRQQTHCAICVHLPPVSSPFGGLLDSASPVRGL